MIRFGLRCVAGWLLLISLAWANEPPIVAPAEIDGIRLLDAEGVVALAQQRPALVIIDSRIGTSRKHGYIEGSHSLADVDTDCASLATLLAHQDTPVLFYCNGPKCGRSTQAIKIAQDCGYHSIYWFRGGFDEWKSKGYPLLSD